MSNEQEQQQLSVFNPRNTKTRVFAHNCYAQPEPLDFVFSGILAGSVAAIVAPGSTGKGFFSLGTCFDLYTGNNLLGLQMPKLNEDQKIAFITAEDQSEVIGHRIHALIKQHEMSANQAIRMDEQVHFISIQGELVLDLVNSKGEVNYTLVNQMIEAYRGYRLIFMDTLARTHTANENDNGNMSVLISVFEYIAKYTGAAFVFIHHTNKGSTLNGQGGEAGAARGAAAITDNIRCQLNLSKITEDEAQHIKVPEHLRHKFLWLHNSKVNYAESGNAALLERTDGGTLRKGQNPYTASNGNKICQFQKG